ncbi:MAG: class I SAM-dependent methyltransferase [Bdellovibrionales bacterium]|nr:class I SAM-dependent methyltransferase [Bdellovibrionales bacterium]
MLPGHSDNGHGRLGLRARRRLIRRVPLPRSGHVLDVGCGNGAFASLWKSLSESTAALSGVDESPSALNVASAEFGYRETFLANWHSPASDAQTYDGILGLEVLQYMPRHLLADFLRRWGERLEPDGALYILYPDRGHPLHRVRRALLGPRHEDYCLPHGLDDLHEAIREAGFRAARQESTGFFLDRGRFCHLLRLEIATGSRDERREKDRPSREAHDPLG